MAVKLKRLNRFGDKKLSFNYYQMKGRFLSPKVTRKAQIETDIRNKSSIMAQLQTLQAHVVTIQNEGKSLQELTEKYAHLAAMFQTNDDQMTFLLTQPPITFLVSFIHTSFKTIYLEDIKHNSLNKIHQFILLSLIL